MIGSLFIRSYERSERIYQAMASRGYSGQALALAQPAWRARDLWSRAVCRSGEPRADYSSPSAISITSG